MSLRTHGIRDSPSRSDHMCMKGCMPSAWVMQSNIQEFSEDGRTEEGLEVIGVSSANVSIAREATHGCLKQGVRNI